MSSYGDPYENQPFAKQAARARAQEYAKKRADLNEELYAAQAMYGNSSGAGGTTGRSTGSGILQQGLGFAADKAGGFLGGALVKGILGIFNKGGSAGSGNLFQLGMSLPSNFWKP